MNFSQWKQLLEKAEAGDAESQWEVASYYEDGLCNSDEEIIVDTSVEKAYHWYLLSAKQGHEASQQALGVLLSSGGGIEPDMNEAIRWSKQAIEQGSYFAAHNLGTIYRDLGEFESAYSWYEKSVEMGNLDSLFEMALCNLLGVGTDKNVVKAEQFLTKIINVDSPADITQGAKDNAYYWLALIQLLLGNSDDVVIAKAKSLLELANKDDDHEQANEVLNILGKF